MAIRASSALLIAALCACGAPSAGPDAARAPSQAPDSEAGSTASQTPTGQPAGAAAETQPLARSQSLDLLADLGFSLGQLPPLEAVPPQQLRRLMGLFTRSLGVDCKHCHEPGDFRAPTANKKLTVRMWNEWVRGKRLVLDDGASTEPLFCDSCHQGKARFLERADGDRLAVWMARELTARVQSERGESHTCASCHGEGASFKSKFLEGWRH